MFCFCCVIRFVWVVFNGVVFFTCGCLDLLPSVVVQVISFRLVWVGVGFVYVGSDFVCGVCMLALVLLRVRWCSLGLGGWCLAIG